jgi:hypothetical protein
MFKPTWSAGWAVLAALGVGITYTAVQASESEEAAKPKHEIADVMHSVHVAPEKEKSLRDRVLEGTAKPEEKQQLLDFYISLAENKPPKGELAAWHKKTRAVVLSAAKVVVGREGAAEELKKATDCAACHKDHKPPKE